MGVLPLNSSGWLNRDLIANIHRLSLGRRHGLVVLQPPGRQAADGTGTRPAIRLVKPKFTGPFFKRRLNLAYRCFKRYVFRISDVLNGYSYQVLRQFATHSGHI